MVTIPKTNNDHTNFPCWIPVTNTKGEERRPHVRCNCGQVTSIGNHHVHADGTVTASYFHSKEMPGGCGWHEHIKFEGYNGSEWPRGRTEQEAQQDFD